MSDAPTNPEQLRLLCEQKGLARALKLFPDGMKGAVERGLRPLGEPAGGLPPILHPAPVFDPARFESEP